MTEMRYRDGARGIARWNDVFGALTSEPRRQLIVSLLDARPDESVPLPESANNPNTPADPDTLRIELCHTHLPKLAGMEFVEWKAEPFTALRGERFEEVACVLEALHSNAGGLPERLVLGCQRLEEERQANSND